MFEVSVFGKALLEKLVGQDASLWETIHPLANLHVDVTIKCLVKEAVVVDDVLREKRERHFHIFKSVKWHFEIHVFDVSSGEPGASGADGAVPKEFSGDHVTGTHGEFKWISELFWSSPSCYQAATLMALRVMMCCIAWMEMLLGMQG